MTASLRKFAALGCGLVMLGFAAALPVRAEEPARAPATEDARLAAFFEDVFQRSLKDNPLFQSYLGMKGPDYGKWNDLSDEEAQRQDQLNEAAHAENVKRYRGGDPEDGSLRAAFDRFVRGR